MKEVGRYVCMARFSKRPSLAVVVEVTVQYALSSNARIQLVAATDIGGQ